MATALNNWQPAKHYLLQLSLSVRCLLWYRLFVTDVNTNTL